MKVATGQRLQRSMENTGLFPNMVNQMIAVGEESGSLDEMSAKVAAFYEAEVDNAVDAMSSLLEPLIMVIPGCGRGEPGDRHVPADLQARIGGLSSSLRVPGWKAPAPPRDHVSDRAARVLAPPCSSAPAWCWDWPWAAS